MANKVKDLTNVRKGNFIFIKRVDRPEHIKNKCSFWEIKCDCGAFNIVNSANALLSKGFCSKKCGLIVKHTNLTGQKFGNLTVESINTVKNGKLVWNCLCKCGERVLKTSHHLNDSTKYCSKKCSILTLDNHLRFSKDISGQVFSRITIKEKVSSLGDESRYSYMCECGVEKVARRMDIVSGNVKSCGCLIDYISSKSRTPLRCGEYSTRWIVGNKRGTGTFKTDLRIVDLYKKAQALSRKEGTRYVVDHIIPLNGAKVSGLHVYNNLQILPWFENLKKGNKFLNEDIV